MILEPVQGAVATRLATSCEMPWAFRTISRYDSKFYQRFLFTEAAHSLDMLLRYRSQNIAMSLA